MKPQMQRGKAAAPLGPGTLAAESLAAAVRTVILLAALSMIALRGWLAPAGAVGQVIAWVGALYLLASAALAWRKPESFQRNALVFSSLDIFLITWFVSLRGEWGPQYLLYYVPILHAAVRMSARNAVSAAVLSAVCYVFAETASPLRGGAVRYLAPVVFGVSAVLIAVIFVAVARKAALPASGRPSSVGDAVNLVRAAAIAADADSAARGMVEASCRALQADAARLSLADPSTGALHAVAATGERATWFSDDTRLAASVQETEEPLFAPAGLPADMASRGLSLPAGAEAYIAVPLRARGRGVGVLELAWARRALSDEDLDTCFVIGAEMAQHLAGALQPTVARSVRDPITGLWSHTEFQQRLAEEVARAGRMQQEVCVLLADIDAFGQFNERHGHVAGDALLASLGHALAAEARAADVAARYGSDEFALLLPETGHEGAMLAAERLRQAVERAALSVPAAIADAVTVTVAVACFPKDGATARDCIAAAQRALSLAAPNSVVSAREIP